MRARTSPRRLRRSLRQLWEGFRYALFPPDWGAVLSDDLPFGGVGERRFLDALSSCDQYLEYGSGASTVAAARAGIDFVAVESDPEFLEAVQQRCRRAVPSGTARQHFVHGDIGRTGPWGKPVFPSIRRPERWRNYACAPWEIYGRDFRADFILVDGRFRVACALAVVINQSDTEWTMLVDDFVGRPEYSAVTEFAQFRGTHGRMAEFGPLESPNINAAIGAFQRYVGDWR